ncbi:hypothetical protein BGZ76_003190 [Entomortierella beljakovae]|nr:hypothetical protein BGZ76_003190 [Entomortierella beljakovae]
MSPTARIFDNNARTSLNESILKQDSTFKFKYFKVHGLAASSRLILATSGSQWECVFPEDWANKEKQETLFGVLPVLYETTSSGQQIEVPESDAIEHYLSKKFRLYGNDDFDEIKIRAFASSIQSFITFYLLRVAVVRDANYKEEMLKRFLTEVLPTFLTTHERHLEANGSNGHYVNDKLSLADIKLKIAVDITLKVAGDTFITKEKTPAIFAVWEKVAAIPSYVSWRKTEAYEVVSSENLRALGF